MMCIYFINATYYLSKLSHELNLCMYSFNSNAKHHLIIRFFLVRQFKLLLLPAKSHLRKSDQSLKNFHFDDVIVAVLETERLTIEVFIVIRVAPSIAVHQITPMTDVAIIVELKFILLHCSSHHHAQQHPRTHIKSSQFDENFALSFTNFGQTGPIHVVISCFKNSVWNSE